MKIKGLLHVLFLLSFLFCLSGCISSGTTNSVTYHSPFIAGGRVYLLRKGEYSEWTQSGQNNSSEYSLHLESFDLRGRLESQVDLGALLGGGVRNCYILTGCDSLLLLWDEDNLGSGYYIYNIAAKKLQTLPIRNGELQFAFDSLGESLWVIRSTYSAELFEYNTHFDRLSLETFDTLQSLQRRGRLHCARRLRKRDREILFSTEDSLVSLSFEDGKESLIDVAFEDYVSFGNDGFVTIDHAYRLYIQTKENVSIDTLYTYASDGSFSSVSLSDDGLFMAYKSRGGVINLYDHEDGELMELGQ